MSLGAIIKRHKRTLINFQESFLLPFVRKAAYRYMQFDPERYPVSDYQFVASSSLGIIAREYEVTQLVQLLQTMSPESPLYGTLIESIVDNMNLANREEMIQKLKEAAQPDPQKQQMEMQAAQAQMAMQQAQTQAFAAQAADFMARAEKNKAEAALAQYDSETDRIKVLSSNVQQGDADEKEFQKRARVAELILKEQEINLKKGMTNANAQTGLGDLGQPQQQVEQPQQSGPTIEPAMRGAGRENQGAGEI